MRLASVLLVLTLLSTSVISGTFAKYTTSDSSEDSARVAKWGFEATDNAVVLDNLFEKSYGTSGPGDGKYVLSANEDNVIAPGTKNEVPFTFSYDTSSNTISAPEVDYTFEVTVDTTGSNTTNLDANPNFYWTLDGTTYDTLDALKTAIEALDGNKPNNRYEAGKLPEAFYGTSAEGAKSHTIGWEWKFENDADVPADDFTDEDEFDTAMGNADSLENIYIKITITATQIN